MRQAGQFDTLVRDGGGAKLIGVARVGLGAADRPEETGVPRLAG
jgi:hypothetical protein